MQGAERRKEFLITRLAAWRASGRTAVSIWPVSEVHIYHAIEEPDTVARSLSWALASAKSATMALALENDAEIIVGGPYSSGVAVGGTHIEYAPAPPEVLSKVAKIRSLAEKYGIGMKAVALQLALAHSAVAAAIPGASRPERIAEDQAALAEKIPDAFRAELRAQHQVAEAAPLPSDESK